MSAGQQAALRAACQHVSTSAFQPAPTDAFAGQLFSLFGRLAGRTLVAAFEVSRRPRERELLSLGVHRGQFSYELFSPRFLEDDLAFTLFAMLVDE
jgi:hypothetical protein